MNKRIKIKKGLLHKKCDNKCINYRIIQNEKLITNNICQSCKLRYKQSIQKILKLNKLNEGKVMHKFKVTLKDGTDSIVECKRIGVVRNEYGSFVEFHSLSETGAYLSRNLDSILSIVEIADLSIVE